MAKDWQESTEKTDTASVQNMDGELKSRGVGAMQGSEAVQGNNSAAKMEPAAVNSETPNQVSLEDLQKPPYDESQLEFRTGSPHADYKMYKDILAAQKQHELGLQASTADIPAPTSSAATILESLAGASDITASAGVEAGGSDKTPMDKYMDLKYGVAPYTDTYPPVEQKDTHDIPAVSGSGLRDAGKQSMQGITDKTSINEASLKDVDNGMCQ